MNKKDDEFPKRKNKKCKECVNADLREYRSTEGYKQRTSARTKIKSIEYRKENREKINEARRNYFLNNPEEIERYRQYKKKHRRSEKGRKNRNTYAKMRRRQDPMQRLIECLRNRILSMTKKKEWKKSTKTQEILGCNYEQVRTHMESQFLPGMTWGNHGRGEGKWHIDHRIPLSIAKTKKELEALCHYTNLQPLWGEDNIRKGAKIMCNPCTFQWTRSESWTDIPEGPMCSPTIYQGFK